MTEARYRGQKVVVVSPDYAEHTKFADHWLPAAAGHRRRAGDGDGARDPEGVLRRAQPCRTSTTTRAASPTCRCSSRCASATARTSPTGSCAPPTSATTSENAEWKTVVLDERTGEPVVPNGSVGHRWGEEGAGSWNLALDGIEPALTLLGRARRARRGRPAALRRRRRPRAAALMRRGVPARRIGGHLVTTVLDLLLPSSASGARACRGLARRLRRPGAVHAGLAGGDHRRRRRPA